MNTTTHYLKTVEPYFSRIVNRDKTFELRKNDRGFQRGDIACLRKYDPKKDEFTGESIDIEITFVLEKFKDALNDDWCIFSFKIINQS